ncbi:sulfotransferase [Dongia sp. agr-C8]
MRPNLFIVGAMKAATTSIAQFLASVDGVHMCRQKEPHHFCTDLYQHPEFSSLPQIRGFMGQQWIRDRDEYLALFPGDGDSRYVAEASTTYLYSQTAAREIAAFSPDARIVILLRHPVRRAFSEYQMNRKIGLAKGSFAQEMAADLERYQRGEFKLFERYVYAGMYAAQVARFLEAFPRERIFIAAIDRPGRDIDGVARELCGFLGLEAQFGVPRLNEAGLAAFPTLNRLLFESGIKGWVSRTLPPGVKASFKKLYYSDATPPKLGQEDLERWTEVFAADVSALSRLVNEDLGHWTGRAVPGADRPLGLAEA